jgi:hypothetical protein
MEVTFPEASLKQLRDRIAAYRERYAIQLQLRQYIARMSKDLGEAITSVKAEAESLPFGYGSDLVEYLDQLDVRAKLNTVLEQIKDYGYFGEGEYLQGNVYHFAEDFLDVEMSCSSKEMPRLSNLKSASFWEYNPETQEAFMVDVLRFDDEPFGEIEHKVYFRINPMQDGPFRVTAEIAPTE